VQDITERLRNEEYLRQFEHIVSSTRDGIGLLDRCYRYRIVNKAYERFSGRKAKSLVGLHVRDYLGDEFFQNSVKERFDRCLDGETVQYRTWVEYPTLGKRFVQVTYYPYYDEENAIEGVVANTRDMTPERLVEEELEKRRKEHHQLLESAPVSILVVQNGSYVYANPYGAALLGYSSPEELVGTPAMSTIAPESHTAVKQRLAEIAAGRENAPQEMVLLRKDGGTLWAESSSIPIVYDERPAALIIGRDLTEKKRIAERLRAAESIAHMGHYDIDLQSGAAFWSEETYRIFGLDASRFEPTMQNYAALIHEEDREAVYAQVEQCIRYQSDFDMVYRIHRDDGNWRTVHSIGRVRTDTAGAVIGLLGTIQDITERTVADAELTESRNRLLSVFRATPTGIGLVQGPERRILEANEKLCAMTGYTRAELIGHSALVLYPSRDDYESVGTEKYRRIAESGTGTVETRWKRKDGTVIDILLASTPLDPADISQGVTFTAMDITEQKRADARIRELVREKETLLKEVQHRVKNSMNTMVSLLSLQADTLQSAEAVAALRDAQSRFRSMGTLYDHLYRNEAHDAGSMREYLADLVRILAGAFPPGMNVRVSTDLEDRVLDGKRLSTLGLIVNELVTNAMKHAFTGRGDGHLHVRSIADGGDMTIVVEDNGKGLPETTTGESSTFGMSMVRALAEQLGGTISFERDGGGARAVLRFVAE
jgi:PAS domain S-box-containing protein